MSGLLDDLRQALRSLRRAPGFTVAAAATLALGIGATTTLVSALDALLFRPPAGVAEPGRVIRTYFHHQNPQFGSWINSVASYPDFVDLTHARTLAAVAAQYMATASLGRGPNARPVSLAAVTADYFRLLGATPLVGRLLGPDDDRADNGSPGLVLSERLWRSQFGADPGVIGRPVPLDDQRFTIVGVARPGFDGGDYDAPEGWVPFTPVVRRSQGPEFTSSRGWYFLTIVARLAPGATRQQAAAEATALISAGRADSTVRNGFQNILVGPVQEARGPDYSASAELVYVLAGVALIVLLIACANVANLLLVRGLVRARELAIRKALGAGQGRVARQLFLEGVWLALFAGAGSLLVCQWGGDLLRRFLLPAGLADSFTIDARVCAIACAASALALLLSSLLPALRVARGDLSPLMKDGASGAGYRRSRLRSVLVVAQVGLSVVLVVGAGLFVRSLQKIQSVDIGYDRDNVVMVSADPGRAGFDSMGVARAFEAMSAAARAYPGVETTALTFGEPFGWSMGGGLKIPGRDSLPRMSSGGPYIQSVTADYFRTMGLAVLQGHGFTDGDRRDHPAVALLGATMARRYFGGESPIGRCLLLGGATACTEVIGVVQDGIRYSPREEPQALYYVPLPPAGRQTHLTLFVRTRTRARDLAAGLRRALQTAVPDLPYVRAQSLDQVLAPKYESYRLGSTLFGLFGAVSLGLAALGIYSVLAYGVRGRVRELGIRMALGATPVSLVSLVLRDGLVLVGFGLLVGLGASLAGGRAVASLLYGVTPTDLLVLGSSGAVLLAAAGMASLLPARRAARVDPMVTLRAE